MAGSGWKRNQHDHAISTVQILHKKKKNCMRQPYHIHFVIIYHRNANGAREQKKSFTVQKKKKKKLLDMEAHCYYEFVVQKP